MDMDAKEPQHDGAASRTLERIAGEVASCHKCPLAATRTQTVPGEGSPTAEIMFVGEGPGREEDQSGRPFVGRAGRFLDELIESLPMRREDVYIANVVKCRPPGNRDPERIEVETCSQYLIQQIKAVDPLVIVPLGRHALGWFVSNPRITADHGKIMRHENRILMPLLHPSAGLRNPENARRLREGIHNIKNALLEGIRVRQESADRATNTKVSVEVGSSQTEVTSPSEVAVAAEVQEEQASGSDDASHGLFERSQTEDEVQAEIRRQRAIEEAEAAAEEEQSKIPVDERQVSFF